jgi:hypothetical protein
MSEGPFSDQAEGGQVLNHQAAVSQDPVLLLGISRRAVTVTLFTVVLVLVVLDVLLKMAQYLGYSVPIGLVQMFDLDRERNLTTWYASIQLAFAALLLMDAACAARLRGRPHFYRLLVLALGFCYLSVDEYISLHERLSGVMQVIGGAALALSAALCCAGWLRDLPVNIRHRALLAGGLYVGGAWGMDVVGAIIRQFGAGLLYAMSTTAEEGLELVGVALFIAVLLDLCPKNPTWGQDTKLS